VRALAPTEEALLETTDLGAPLGLDIVIGREGDPQDRPFAYPIR
jgi:hypothetical protein